MQEWAPDLGSGLIWGGAGGSGWEGNCSTWCWAMWAGAERGRGLGGRWGCEGTVHQGKEGLGMELLGARTIRKRDSSGQDWEELVWG